MEKSKSILLLGRLFFWASFIAGNICFFGYIIKRDWEFAFWGFKLLIYGTIANTIILAVLAVYAVVVPELKTVCSRAARIMVINIPVAFVYAIIGLVMLDSI